MMRCYGSPPYAVALLHGGPGDRGSLRPMAECLSAWTGVLEPFQSGFTIEALVEELYGQLAGNVQTPVTLVGHSWGAWLALFFSVRHRECVRQLVLVGCPPFDDRYVPQIMERRLRRLAPEEQAAFSRLSASPHLSEEDMQCLARLVGRADNYHTVTFANECLPDVAQYEKVWSKAAAFRSSGGFVRLLPEVLVPIHVIHGEDDPHPLAGAIEPLERLGVGCSLCVLGHCGHSPFLELEARDEFYARLTALLG